MSSVIDKPMIESAQGRSLTLPRAVILLMAVWLAYAPALANGYIWDDDYYLTQNALVRDADGLPRIWLNVLESPQYYPLVFTSYWLEYRLWGLQPIGYHAVNLILHAASAWMFWQILKRLRVPGAYFAALLFAVHPIGVETVAWVTERKNTLSLFCGLISFWFLLRPFGLDETATTELSPRRRKWHYAAALIWFVFALLSKSVVCALPPVVCIVLYWKSRLSLRAFAALLPFFVLGALAGLHTAWLEQTHVGAVGAEFSLTWAQRTILAGRVAWFYAGKILCPWPLMFVYPRWNPDDFRGWQWLFPFTAFGLPLMLWALQRRIGRGPSAAILCFGVILFPALGFINVYPFRYSFVADHFQYHAGLALFALIGAAAWRLTKLCESSSNSLVAKTDLDAHVSRWAMAVVGCVVVVLGLLVRERLPDYRNAVALWQNVIIDNPQAWIARNNLGMLYLLQGQYKNAAEQFSLGLQLKPDDGIMHNNLGMTQLHRQDFVTAVGSFQKAVEYAPRLVRHRQNLAAALVGAGRYDEAVDVYREAVRLSAHNPYMRISLAWLLATRLPERATAPREAINLAAEAVRLADRPEPTALDTLAAAHATMGEFAEARRIGQEAFRVAQQAGNAVLAEEIASRLRLYERHQPFRSAL